MTLDSADCETATRVEEDGFAESPVSDEVEISCLASCSVRSDPEGGV